jgi:solute:Na+ symporter, SSS family
MVDITVYIVIGMYMLLMVVFGLAMRWLNKDVSDYFRSGCKGTWWLVGASTFMASFSALTFTGAAGAAFESGWSISIVYISGALGFVINAVWLAPWFRQTRAITAPQVINERFGQMTQQFYAWIGIVLGIFYAALFLYGLSIFIASIFGFPITAVVCVIGLVVLTYSVTGGNWAVMGTDFLQTLILVPITLLMAYLSIRAIGGWGSFLDHAAEPGLAGDFAMFNDNQLFGGRYTMLWSVAMMIKIVVGYNTLNTSSRYFAVKDGREARKAAWLGAVLMACGAIIWMIPPMVGRMLYADQVLAMQLAKPAESAYAVVSLQLLPKGLIGLMAVAIMAATMSSMDTGLNKSAAIFTQDIYPLLCKWIGVDPVKDRALLRRGQAFSLVLGLIIILMCLYCVGQKGLGVFEHMQTVGAALASPLAMPMLLALFIRRAPWWSGIFAVTCALIPSCIGLMAGWTFAEMVFWNVGTGATAFLISMPFWRFASIAYRTKVEVFFEQMHRPVDFAREVGEGNDLQQLVVLGWFALSIGTMISLLMLFSTSGHDRICVLFVAVFVSGAGALLIYAGRRASKVPQDMGRLPHSETLVEED